MPRIESKSDLPAKRVKFTPEDVETILRSAAEKELMDSHATTGKKALFVRMESDGYRGYELLYVLDEAPRAPTKAVA